jgi:hypothetical protein
VGYLEREYSSLSLVSITGNRRDESLKHRAKPVAESDTKATQKPSQVHLAAIIDNLSGDVSATLNDASLRRQEAYVIYLTSTVSCSLHYR